MNNNPVRYTDPSGHSYCDSQNAVKEECNWKAPLPPLLLLQFSTDRNQSFTPEEIQTLEAGAWDVANALARDMNAYCIRISNMGEGCSLVSPQEAFYQVFGGPISVKRVAYTCNCWAEHRGRNANGQYEIWVYSSTSTKEIVEHPRLIAHEIGHAFHRAIKDAGLSLPINSMSTAGVDNREGFAGREYSWQLSVDMAPGEIYADMFVGWVYGRWETSPEGVTDAARKKMQFMTRTISDINGITGR
jgi:hypothetical protein